MPKERTVKEDAEILVSLLDPNNLATVSLSRQSQAAQNSTVLWLLLYFTFRVSRSLFVVSVFLKGNIIPWDKERGLFLCRQEIRENIND